MKIKLNSSLPGPKSKKILLDMKKINGGKGIPFPFVHSRKGKGSYFEDLDSNVFLDFACQIASNPLGYNHPDMIKVIRNYQNFPVKYAGQDFFLEEHRDLIKKLISISPKNFNSAFLVNSGAEAVENSMKISMRKKPKMKFSVSFDGAFHGRTLGALSLHHSNEVHRKGYVLEPNKKLPWDDSAGEKLNKLIKQHGVESVGFVILEHFQGEGGYRIPSKKMIREVRKICLQNEIPYISDEVQAGMGRTGKFWSFEHYGIKPDIFSSAKALQIGAVVANKKMFPEVPGSISSTWGGGHRLDLALGIKTIELIEKQKLLQKNRVNGAYFMKGLNKLGVENVRGRGLMIAFDLENQRKRDDFIIESLKNGLVLLGAGEKSIRVIPPYIITRNDMDLGLEVIEKTLGKIGEKGFKHSGKICEFVGCGIEVS